VPADPGTVGIGQGDQCTVLEPGLFGDGTRWYGIPAPFFQSKEKNYL